MIIRVEVNHWRTFRYVVVMENMIVFQVTIGCSHCATCQSRVAHVERALDHTGVKSESVLAEEMLFRVFERVEGEDPLVTLGNAMELTLRPVETVPA